MEDRECAIVIHEKTWVCLLSGRHGLGAVRSAGGTAPYGLPENSQSTLKFRVSRVQENVVVGSLWGRLLGDANRLS